MVSELAGEGAMPLPAPASHDELRRVHLQRQIHKRSLLRRGVTNLKFDNASRIHSFASFNLWRSFNVAAKILKRRAGPGAVVGSGGGFKASKQESSCNWSRVLINHLFKASNCTSWSRSMKNSSKSQRSQRWSAEVGLRITIERRKHLQAIDFDRFSFAEDKKSTKLSNLRLKL